MDLIREAGKFLVITIFLFGIRILVKMFLFPIDDPTWLVGLFAGAVAMGILRILDELEQ